MRCHTSLLLTTSLLFAGFLPATALAQSAPAAGSGDTGPQADDTETAPPSDDSPTDIVVTALRRSERLQNVPASISAMSVVRTFGTTRGVD